MSGDRRRCAYEDCLTIVSAYNHSRFCFQHQEGRELLAQEHRERTAITAAATTPTCENCGVEVGRTNRSRRCVTCRRKV